MLRYTSPRRRRDGTPPVGPTMSSKVQDANMIRRPKGGNGRRIMFAFTMEQIAPEGNCWRLVLTGHSRCGSDF